MLSATRIRIYPSTEQQEKLAVQFGCARWVWNEALEATQKAYAETGRGVGYFALCARIPKLREGSPWLGDAYSQVLRNALMNLSRAFENFFEKRARYPRFKSKNGPQSIGYPQNVKLCGQKIVLPKIGKVKAVIHRQIVGNIKTVTVTKNAAGQYHASILTDDGLPTPAVSHEGKAIGIDVGLTDLAVTSDGSKFSNPRHLNKSEKILKRRSQKLSRKKKGSKNREKARLRVAKAFLKVTNIRRDYLHKLSRRLINENQVIVVEDLNVKGMMKNHKLARAIGDAGWGTLTQFLQYKAEREGKAFIRAGRFYPSSKSCSACGCVCDKIPLRVRSWICAHCGASHDRDVNAAKNIRDEGLRLIAAGVAVTACRGDLSRRKKLASKSAIPDEVGNLRRKTR